MIKFRCIVWEWVQVLFELKTGKMDANISHVAAVLADSQLIWSLLAILIIMQLFFFLSYKGLDWQLKLLGCDLPSLICFIMPGKFQAIIWSFRIPWSIIPCIMMIVCLYFWVLYLYTYASLFFKVCHVFIEWALEIAEPFLIGGAFTCPPTCHLLFTTPSSTYLSISKKEAPLIYHALLPTLWVSQCCFHWWYSYVSLHIHGWQSASKLPSYKLLYILCTSLMSCLFHLMSDIMLYKW